MGKLWMKFLYGLMGIATALAIAMGCSATPQELPPPKVQADSIMQISPDPYQFQISYTTDQPRKLQPLVDQPLRVVGPQGFQQEAQMVRVEFDDGTSTALFRVKAPGDRWDADDNGTYTITLANADRQNDAANVLATFEVSIASEATTKSTAPQESKGLLPLPEFGATGESSGTVYYVSPSGNDDNTGTSATSPFRTADQALSVVKPGDTVQFAAGTYESLKIANLRGEANAPITLKGDRQTVFSTGSYERDAGISIEDSTQVILEGLTVNRSLWGIMGERLQNVTIRNCHTFDIGQEAIHVRDRSSYLLIAENRIHDTGRRGGEYSRYGEGVYVGRGASGGETDGTHHVLIHRNEIFRTSSEAIDLKRGLHDLIAQYNTIYDINTEVRAAVNVMDGPTGEEHGYILRGNVIRNISGKLHHSDGTGIRIFGDGVEVYNNLVYNTEAYGIRSEGNSDGDRKIYYNTVYNGGSEGDIIDETGKADVRNNIGALGSGNIPAQRNLFVDSNGGNFRLVNSAAPAIDRGQALSTITIDILGEARPKGRGYDLGAYENW